MRHTSLDESFWPSVAAALGSDAPLPDVETLLLDVSSLVDALLDASRSAGERVALLTLTSGESERAFGLALAALAARRGRRVLAADLDLSDDTWTRLLGGERLDGLADHLELGIPAARLVRATSWDTLWLLPAGARGADPDLLLRSGGVAACLERAAGDRDLVCVGMPFRPWLEWGAGPTAGIRRAVLIGPAGDELAFELAMPRLLPSVELLGTVDVPPLGRWRPALGAALPSLRPEGAWTADVPEESRRLATREPGPWGYAGAFPLLDDTDAGTGTADRAGPPGGRRLTTLGRAAQASLSLGERAVSRRAGDDAEVQADVAFLTGLPTPPGAAPDVPREGASAAAGRSQPEHVAAGPSPAGAHDPDAVRRTWLAWDERTGPEPPRPEMRDLASQWSAPEAPRAPELLHDERGDGGRWGTTALVAFLCVFLGAGIYWTWRSSRPIPDGEFEFVDAGSAAVNVRSEDEAASAGASDEATLRAGSGEAAAPADGGADAQGAGGDAGGEGAGDLDDDARGANPAGELPDGPADAAEAEASRTDPAGDGEPPVRQGAGGAGRFAPPQAGPLRGFSLHVGSFQTREAAARAAAALRANGASAFVVPVLLEGKGQWYRVFADALPDRPAGEARLREVLAKGVVPEGHVRETPWALYLGTYASVADAAKASEKVARSGISAYALGDDPVHLYAGAFETAADAELLNRELRDRGFEAEIVRRRAGGPR